MIAATYKISGPDKWVIFHAKIIAFLVLLKKFIKLRIKKTGLIDKLNKELVNYLRKIQHVSFSIDSMPAEKLPTLLKQIDHSILLYSRLYDICETAHYFRNKRTKQIIEATFEVLYKIQSKVQHKVYSSVERNPEDEILKNIAAKTSLNAIPTAGSC